MYPLGTKGDRKHTHPNIYIPGEYLLLASEPKDVQVASRGSYGFRNRYLAKQHMLRTLRKIRLG
jgi:hypothetical protein